MMIEDDQDPEKANNHAVSQKKLDANRKNARLSTGPKTKEGKRHSRRNALKHGILANKLLIKDGLGAEDEVAVQKLSLLFAETERRRVRSKRYWWSKLPLVT